MKLLFGSEMDPKSFHKKFKAFWFGHNQNGYEVGSTRRFVR